MASPHRVVAVASAAALTLIAIATAWPAAVDGNTLGNTPANTPTDTSVSDEPEMTGERAVSLSPSPSKVSAADQGSQDDRIACGGTSPLTEKCTTSELTLHSPGVYRDIEVEPGFKGTVTWLLTSSTDVTEWVCEWDGTESFTGEFPTCSFVQIGDFSPGDKVRLHGNTIQTGTDPVDDTTYGIWQVAFENR